MCHLQSLPSSKRWVSHALIGLLWSLLQAGFVRAVESHPGILTEANYSEAVLFFNSKNYAKALTALADILKVEPNHIPSLQLRALTLKTQGNDAEAAKAYRKLISVEPKEKRPPYYFELGTILHRQKKFDEAVPLLERAVAGNFNIIPARFFLGTAALETQDFDRADQHLSFVAGEAKDDLSVAAHFFLAVALFKSGYGPGGTQELIAAKAAAAKMPGSAVSQNINVAADKALAPFDQVQWYGNFSFSSQYDGNVSSLSSSNTLPAAVSGKKSMKLSLSGGGGRLSSPLRPVQWVAAYRASFNKNLNPDSATYEFFSNVPSIYLTVDPLAKINYGWKAEGTLTFQNQEDDSGAHKFRPYSYSLETGPFVKLEPLRRLRLTIEGSFRPQKFPGEEVDTASDDLRSGTVWGLRLNASRDTSSRFFNPSGSVAAEMDRASGVRTRSTSYSFSFSNSFILPKETTLGVSLGLNLAKYPDAALGARSDSNLSFRANLSKALVGRWSLTSDVGYTKNTSNFPTLYSYDKPTFSVGASYSL